MSFLIIECSRCGTPQYIRLGQHTRICPKCNLHINCQTVKPLTRVSSEKEAVECIQSMKTPNELEERIKKVRNLIKKNENIKQDKSLLFSNLISELLGLFPNAMPKKIIYIKAAEINLDSDFVTKLIKELESNGFLLNSVDFQNNEIIKFINLPITLGNIHIKKPKK